MSLDLGRGRRRLTSIGILVGGMALLDACSGGGSGGGTGGRNATGGGGEAGAVAGRGGVGMGGSAGGPPGSGGAAGGPGGAAGGSAGAAGGRAGAAGASAGAPGGGGAGHGGGGAGGSGGPIGGNGGAAGGAGTAGGAVGGQAGSVAPPITACHPDSPAADAETCSAATPTPVTVSATGLWAAWQDGDGVWVNLPLSGSSVKITPTSCSYAVAVVCSATKVLVSYRTTATTSLIMTCNPSGSACLPMPTTVTGNLLNVGSAQWAAVNNGSAGEAITPAGGTAPYQFSNVTGPHLAVGIASASGQPLSRIAVVRNALQPDAGHEPSAAALDVDLAAEGLPTIMKSIGFTGLGPGDTQATSVTWSPAPLSGYCPASKPLTLSSGAGITYPSLDPSQIQSGDVYQFSAGASQTGHLQSVSLFGTFTAAQDLTFPLTYPNAVATSAGSTPYGRIEATVPAYPNGSQYSLAASCSAGSGSLSWYVDATSAWVAGRTCFQLSEPDLSGAAGWNAAWGCPTGVAIRSGLTISMGSASTTGLVASGTAYQTLLAVTP